MRILVDTSIWSSALRRNNRIKGARVEELRSLISYHRVDIIGTIRQELLSGVHEDNQFTKSEKHLASFPDIALLTEDYIIAAKFFNICRSKGVQGSNTDFKFI